MNNRVSADSRASSTSSPYIAFVDEPPPKSRASSSHAAPSPSRRRSSHTTPPSKQRSLDSNGGQPPRYLSPSPPQSRPSSRSRDSEITHSPPPPLHLVPNGSVSRRTSSRATSSRPTSRITPDTHQTSISAGPQLHTKTSNISIAPSEGEDPDSFHVRSTYAQLEVCGVKGDGLDEGVERTRARVGGSRQSELLAANAVGDESEKTRELTPREIAMFASIDRYGFFTTPSHDRLVLLPRSAFLKTLSRVGKPVTTGSAAAQTLSSLPPSSPPANEAERMEKWGRMLEPRVRDHGGNVELWNIKGTKEHKLRRRVFKGIPDRWRMAAWQSLIDEHGHTGKKETAQLTAEYREALDKPSEYDIQIDLDVPRTISGHVMFRTRYGLGQRSLFHVLHSFSLRCNRCGYCQGMGPIAAMFLCYFAPERAYASLVHLHDSFHMHDIFSPGFPGLLEAIYVQERVTADLMPGVYAAFKTHMISTTSYATKWYITLFANSVPYQTLLRLWDAFLLEGPDLFVVVAVSVIWAYRDHITAESANFETVLSLLSSFFVPEDEDAMLNWIAKVLENKKLRADMVSWRSEWKGLVASGKDGQALL
ncbi:RabGAP/TBC [Auriscalpium vulgare]|uniref:RabGAP/TBC n=1 Tax=Auriscalpium vulgare TaxID=40419 RepID=A0ACB8S2K2_9AGAM|nr:RabGAP/TBC [Auriscalpium vulgare]